MKELKVGMISFAHGHAHGYLLQLLRIPEVRIVGIADDVPERVAEIVEKLNVPYYRDYRELLQSDADAVVICSENALHAEMTIAAASAGKHILCEKPLGVSVPEMERMVAACRKAGVQLMTGFPCRFHPSVVQAKEAVARGDIGEIIAIKGRNRGSLPSPSWFVDKKLSGGGALIDHTVHVADLMRWILGAEAVEVYGYASNAIYNRDFDDMGMVHIRFDNGVFAVLDPSWSRNKSMPAGGDVAMDIIGKKGMISVDLHAQKNDLYTLKSGKGVRSYWGDNMNEGMVRGFVFALLEGHEVPVSGTDGMRATEIALAAYASSSCGQPVAVAR